MAVDVYDSINVAKLDHYILNSSGWKESIARENILQFN